METPVKLYADFNNADSKGRIRLNSNGTIRSLSLMNLHLKPGLHVLLDDEEGLSVLGVVQFSDDENIWVAKVDWNKIKNY